MLCDDTETKTKNCHLMREKEKWRNSIEQWRNSGRKEKKIVI